jgi:ferredoxin
MVAKQFCKARGVCPIVTLQLRGLERQAIKFCPTVSITRKNANGEQANGVSRAEALGRSRISAEKRLFDLEQATRKCPRKHID